MPNKKEYARPVPLSSKLVQNSHLFSQLPDKLVDDMTSHFRAERWHKKIYIDKQLLLQRFYLLLEGRIELIRTNPETGRSITLDLLFPGDGFDIISLLDGRYHEVTYAPLEEIKVISVPIEKMREWIWTYPELNRQFMPYLAQKMREQEDKTTDFALYDTVTRLSRIILKNVNKIKSYTGLKDNEHEQHLINGLSDEVLARMVGSVRQVVNQHLQHWKKEGVIDKQRNKIMIKDLQAIMDDANYISSEF